ncbi:putative fatty acid desaturase [Bombardia bombarda]|uniref:Delta 8-(E)-sphingolipid desaturase n=1 Tax=Bombardia bombarda TaxID=252184 RepID=A0AA39TKF8_9PEZI|nr:putative fatty acid desaturase [Bombardia bombarda]
MAARTKGIANGATAGANGKRSYPILSRREIEGLIADGRSIIIVDQHVLKVDGWLKYHPGGDKAIQHMVGRDATDEVNGLHSAEARQMMDKYRVGRIEGRWNNFLPPIQGGKFRPASAGECDDEDAMALEQQRSASSPSFAMDVTSSVTSSHASSRSPSPVFDTAATTTTTTTTSITGSSRLRPRTSLAASVSSVSSADEAEEPLQQKQRQQQQQQPFDGLAHLDALTKKEIKLDLDTYPSLDAAVQDDIVAKYRLLHQKIRDEGLFDCDYTAYAIECTRYAIFFGLSLVLLHYGWYAASGFFMGTFWHQLVFTAHDAGHMGITHKFHVDTVIGIIIADFLGGLSLGWWKRSHNVHHIVTNSPEHDPDIEHMPFFAVSHRLLGSLRSTYYERVMHYDAAARFLISFQHYSYYIILLFGRFNLYRLSWEFLILGLGPRKGPAWWHRYLEMAGQVFFWYWFGYELVYKSIDTNWHRFVFIMVSHMVTAPLHVQITLSHFAMSTADLGVHESFPQKMLRTTMDVDCPQWLDFFHGGLQFQAIHHLYPRIPRHNLRQTQKLVQAFCEEVGIPYALYGFVDGNKEVIGRLADVARQAAILKKCQGVIAGGGLGHHHHD